MINQLNSLQQAVEGHLSAIFRNEASFAGLTESMRYSLLAGGKRIRPVLALAFAEACGAESTEGLDAACSLELLHTYSLIHDDLPCMDNDALRRGKPTNHIVFGETTAVLAGDCLQAEAFALLANSSFHADRVSNMIRSLSKAAGLQGICGGQALDIAAEGKTPGLEELTEIHKRKTAALIMAACEIGVFFAGGSERQAEAANHYGKALGLAFQIQDDVLDVIASEDELGKPIGSDKENAKYTFIDLFGLNRCREMIHEQTELACQSLTGHFENVDFLCWLARYLAGRTK